MWEAVDERLALLELLCTGTLKRRRVQAAAFATLSELPWARATGRRNEIGLVERHRRELVVLLERVWPDWQRGLTVLTARGLPPTPDGWSRLLDVHRAEGLPELPARLNRRTAAALTAPHSKAGLTERRRLALRGAQPTHDGAVRLRPPPGLLARSPTHEVDLGTVAAVLGEVSIPERAFLEGLELTGTPRAVLLVENLGAWRDLTPPPGWLLAHVPGWDTTTVSHLLRQLTSTPTAHFGDLDPNGLRIYRHLSRMRPDLRWFVPSFWSEFVTSHGLSASWPLNPDLEGAPRLVRDLCEQGLWLEQESIVLDPRLLDELERLLEP